MPGTCSTAQWLRESDTTPISLNYWSHTAGVELTTAPVGQLLAVPPTSPVKASFSPGAKHLHVAIVLSAHEARAHALQVENPEPGRRAW